jgi:hypothetical protein
MNERLLLLPQKEMWELGMDIFYRLSPDWSRVLAGSLGGFPRQKAKKQWPCGVVAGILGPIAAIVRNGASQRSDSIIREGRLSPEGIRAGSSQPEKLGLA